MSAQQLLDDLGEIRATLTLKADGSGFSIEALPGVITPNMLRQIKRHKKEIAALIGAKQRSAERGIRIVPPRATPIYDVPECCRCPTVCPTAGPCPNAWCGRDDCDAPSLLPLDQDTSTTEARRYSHESIIARLERLRAQAARPGATELDRKLANDWEQILEAKIDSAPVPLVRAGGL